MILGEKERSASQASYPIPIGILIIQRWAELWDMPQRKLNQF
jgi:hypothetical protein